MWTSGHSHSSPASATINMEKKSQSQILRGDTTFVPVSVDISQKSEFTLHIVSRDNQPDNSVSQSVNQIQFCWQWSQQNKTYRGGWCTDADLWYFVRVVPPYSSQAIDARRGYKYFGPGHQSSQFRIHQSLADYSSSLTLQVWTLQVCLGKKSRCLLIYLYIFEFMWKYNCLVNAQVFLCTIFWSYIVIGLLLLDIIRPSRKIWYWQKSPKHHPSQSWWLLGGMFPYMDILSFIDNFNHNDMSKKIFILCLSYKKLLSQNSLLKFSKLLFQINLIDF